MEATSRSCVATPGLVEDAHTTYKSYSQIHTQRNFTKRYSQCYSQQCLESPKRGHSLNVHHTDFERLRFGPQEAVRSQWKEGQGQTSEASTRAAVLSSGSSHPTSSLPHSGRCHVTGSTEKSRGNPSLILHPRLCQPSPHNHVPCPFYLPHLGHPYMRPWISPLSTHPTLQPSPIRGFPVAAELLERII